MRVTRPTRSCVLLFLLLLLARGTSARAEDDFLSLETVWSSELESPPLSPPVADARHVYLSLRSGQLRAFALADGRTAWTIDLPLTTALAEADGMLVGATKEELIALDGATGQALWRIHVADVGVGPALRAGWAIAGSGPDLLAFRAADGSLVWRLTLGAALHTAVTIDGDRVYAPLEDGTLAAVEITSGKLVWRKKLPAPAGTLTAAGDRLYFGAADKFFYAFGAKDGDRDWRWRAAAAILAPAAVDEWRVYYTALDNVVRGVDAGSGVQKWRYAMDARPLAGPVLDGEVLVLATATDLRAVRSKDGTLAAQWRAPGELASAPVLVPPGPETGSTRAVIVTGAATGDWRVYGLGPAPEPRPQPLKEIPGRPLSPDVPPSPPEPPRQGGSRLP